ncbi:uncharacterized protein THITE_2122730 [Thermothielavioides terrestris NRRL 8126]|uniref:F-box domain-containing protein n=1 Tax=Thermothielavioides terrestris (strain ATCC 38088 / NRRL 8126) TaxID=578455 RepID=G2RE04_THETT|nr:uncharacterized protein THITE_2122730 [Thermothielavioides terrestris NRRL 8126]AEO70887.1 hypothetical protein THITE_2122730 [Thermothielavioides terrestris NRRL 8126]
MDFLPVELVRLVFLYCDAPSVRALRLASARYADVGYEFLLEPHFTAVEWRDDITRLYNIAGHDRLRGSIRSLTFNFSKVDEYNARHTTFFQHWLQEPEERCALLQDAWTKYYELEEGARKLPPLHTRSAAVEEAFKRLPNLKDLEITLTKCPYDIEVLNEVFQVRSCRKRDRSQACKNLNAIVSAVRHVRLSSLSIDQLPLEIFRLPDDRRHWFDCARSFASLSRLNLVLDPPSSLLPSARFRAINGLGHVLHYCVNLTHLSLAFHTYHAPLEKFHLSFQALFCGSDFAFPRLTDLKLEGVSCAEDDLRGFLLRHAATLERLRLGGRGLARPHEWSIGGVHLHEGSFRSLFASLQGRLPRLRRFHMEGDAEAGDFMASSREVYVFRPVTDDDWQPVEASAEGKRRYRPEGLACVKTVDCLALERFLVEGGEYPQLGKAVGE